MRYEAPKTIDDAVSLLASAEATEPRILAGGTDLLVQLRTGVVAPSVIVDIKNIKETQSISTEDGAFRIGAAVSGAMLGEHSQLRMAWPGVVEATELIGSTQIQGRASIGGNLGNASPAADTVPALIAANAICSVPGPTGRRNVAVSKIGTGPGQTSLAKGEFRLKILSSLSYPTSTQTTLLD